MEPFWTDGKATLYQGDCLAVLRELPSESVHCCVTSPPYWGLRDYGADGQLGLERTPQAYVEAMVSVFREVWRVLRDDGTCWINLGDSYATGSGGSQTASLKQQSNKGTAIAPRAAFRGDGCKPKDLVGIPWRVAFALQADGWYLRQDIIWHKPNPMPESVTDRCTKAHEYIFLLSKSERYYYDNFAIAEPAIIPGDHGFLRGPVGGCDSAHVAWRAKSQQKRKMAGVDSRTAGGETRNRRSVWTVTTKPYPGAHFATFPPDLIEPCILAGTSAEGCCSACGAPWERVVEKPVAPPEVFTHRSAPRDELCYSGSRVDGEWKGQGQKLQAWRDANPPRTVGWRPTCAHVHDNPTPCVVLEPFAGSGTTLEVARRNGCQSIGIELNPEYCGLVVDRLRQRVLI